MVPCGFNMSTMVFTPKGEIHDEEMIISRHAKHTRPLTLSNTDAKIFALAINHRLAQLCVVSVVGNKWGFVNGCDISENIIEVEGAMLRASIVPQRSAAAILFDFATAFPSIAHDWIFLVLGRLGTPEKIRRVIRLLYSNVVSLMLERHVGNRTPSLSCNCSFFRRLLALDRSVGR